MSDVDERCDGKAAFAAIPRAPWIVGLTRPRILEYKRMETRTMMFRNRVNSFVDRAEVDAVKLDGFQSGRNVAKKVKNGMMARIIPENVAFRRLGSVSPPNGLRSRETFNFKRMEVRPIHLP